MKILILEDDPNRHKKFREKLWEHAEDIRITDDIQECTKLLMSNKWDYLFLDHDLGGEVYVESDGDKPTGYKVAAWLEANQEYMPKNIVLHSLNCVGRTRMKQALPNAEDVPWAWELAYVVEDKIHFRALN